MEEGNPPVPKEDDGMLNVIHVYRYFNHTPLATQAPPPDDGDDDTDVSDIDNDEPAAGDERMKKKKRQVTVT